jgi:hypothetical protein
VNPLTGLPVDDPDLLLRRPVAVKITNHPREVRPQYGLSLADIVFDYYIEEGITRFIAVFYGHEPERAGPVRSGRFFDEHVFRMYNAYFVFANADDRVEEYFFETLERTYINRFVLQRADNTAEDCAKNTSLPLCRDPSLQTYNNLFVNLPLLHQFVQGRGMDDSPQDLSGMAFSADAPAGGDLGLSLTVRYSYFMQARWVFDYTLGSYLRFQELHSAETAQEEAFTPLIDRLTGEKIRAENVVLLLVPHTFHTRTETTEIVQIDLTGGGRAFVFRDGLVFPAQWLRPDLDKVLQILTPQGAPLLLKPGVTFYQVVSDLSEVFGENGHWRVVFHLPEE